MAVGAEDVLLCLLAPVRGELETVCTGEARLPAGRGTTPRERDHDSVVGRQIELVAAEAARHENAVEARAPELLVRLLRVERPLLCLGLALEQHRPHRLCAGDDLVRSQVGLGHRDCVLPC